WINQFLMDHPTVVGDRFTTANRGVTDRIRGGVKSTGDRGLSTIHARHVIGRENDLRPYWIGWIDGFDDTFWCRTTVFWMIHVMATVFCSGGVLVGLTVIRRCRCGADSISVVRVAGIVATSAQHKG